MFINTATGDVLNYSSLRVLPLFAGVGWPSDESVVGIDDLIDGSLYARLRETAIPDAGPFEVAYISGGTQYDVGKWEAVWTIRAMTTEEMETTQAAIKYQYEEAVQLRLDEAAKSQGYDNIMTAVSYADEVSVEKFQQEGQAFRAWRSLVWAYVYAQLAAVQAGDIPQPTVADLLAALPVLSLPEAE